MKFQAQSLFFASCFFALTTPTSAHGDHGIHVENRSLLPRHHQYAHNVRGTYSHSRSSNILKARGVEPGNLQKREKSPAERLKLAEAYIKKETVEGTEWEVDSWYTDKDTGITHVFAVQTIGGIRVDNARFNVNVLKDGTVFSSGSSFTKHTKAKRDMLQKRRHKLNPVDALKGAVETLHLTDPKIFEKARAGRTDSKAKYKLTGGKSHKKNKGFKKPEYIIDGAEGLLSKPEATLSYMQREDGSLELTWRLEYDGGGDWLIIYTDAYEKSKIHSVADYTAHAQYLVYNFDLNDPSEGERTLEVDPFRKNVSPLGWQQDSDEEFTVLRGNNIIAVVNPGPDADQKDWTELYSPDGGADMDYSYDFPMDSLNFSDWQDAAATQLFYTNNMIHDLYEQLGFTSQSGNFEDDLIGDEGGEGGDAVDVHVQYGAPINTTNAYFATPPDGERPRMMMFLWPNPNGVGLAWRDSCFSRDVVIHEYTHGLSTRLTGGPETAECLWGTWESRGMGEGWGDFYAMAIGMKPEDTREKDYKLVPWLWIPDGQYDDPAQTGLRSWSYSTNMEINPLLYSSMDQEGMWGLQHQIGTIWCTILVEFLWNMVDKHGIEADKFPVFQTHEGTGYDLPTTGRHLAMKIVLEAMKLQPCNPSFVDARNAILDADIILTGGENYCEIWLAFAKRGLGLEAYDATVDTEVPLHVDDFSVPGECVDGPYQGN